MAILVASTWLRVLVHLRLSFLVGPLLKMVVHMTKDILKFILLLIFILFAFASVGKIELPIPEFRDIGTSRITLYAWMLGQFDFETVAPAGLVGQLFLAFYLLVFLVLLLNFIIAILSSTYARHLPNAAGLYLENILEQMHRWAFHPKYNGLTFKVPFFNLSAIFFLPCIRRPRCAWMLELMLYLPAYFYLIMQIFIINVVLLPLAFFFLLRKFLRARSRRFRRLIHLLIFPMLAPMLLMVDILLIAKKIATKPDVPMKTSNRIAKPIVKRDLITLASLLRDQYSGMADSVPLTEIVY